MFVNNTDEKIPIVLDEKYKNVLRNYKPFLHKI